MTGPDRVAAALEATCPPDPAVRPPVAQTPLWRPGVTHDGDEGEITSGPSPDTAPDWETIFAHWNLRPEDWEVVPGTLKVNAWEGPTTDGVRVFRQFKASIRRRAAHAGDNGWQADRLLCDLAGYRPPRRRRPVPAADGPAWVVAAADFQVGGRGGYDAFLARFTAAMDDLVDRARSLRREKVTHLVVGFLGDMAEGVAGNFPGQLFETDLDRDDQQRAVAGVELTMIRELAPYFASTTAVAVPGNHARNNRGYETGEHDTADMTAFRWAASMLAYAGDADRWNCRFVTPEKHHGALIARVEAAGTRLLFSHGHKAAGSADRLRGWWRDVSFTRWGDADATDHLLTGHRHHLRVEECARDRWLFVCPTLGGDSAWFHDTGGPTSAHGILNYVTWRRTVRWLDVAGAPRPDNSTMEVPR